MNPKESLHFSAETNCKAPGLSPPWKLNSAHTGKGQWGANPIHLSSAEKGNVQLVLLKWKRMQEQNMSPLPAITDGFLLNTSCLRTIQSLLKKHTDCLNLTVLTSCYSFPTKSEVWVQFFSSSFFLLPSLTSCLTQTKSSTPAAHSQLVSSCAFLRSDIDWDTRKEGRLEFSFWKYFALCHAQWVSSTRITTIALLSFWHVACRNFSLCTWLVLYKFYLYVSGTCMLQGHVCFFLFYYSINENSVIKVTVHELFGWDLYLCLNTNKILQNWKLTELIQCLIYIPLICSVLNMISISCERLEKQQWKKHQLKDVVSKHSRIKTLLILHVIYENFFICLANVLYAARKCQK